MYPAQTISIGVFSDAGGVWGKYVGFWMYPLDDIVERFPHGTMYSGDWKNGKYDGQGTITFPDGSMYVGTFKDGEYHGHGNLTLPDGRVLKGIWRRNKLVWKK